MADSMGAGLARMRETHNPHGQARAALLRAWPGRQSRPRAASERSEFSLDGMASAPQSAWPGRGCSRRVALFAQTFYTLGGRASDDESQPVTGLLALRSFC